MNWIQNGGTAAILDLLKSLISPARLDRFLPNFADRRTEAIDMFPMSLTFELDPEWRCAAILDFIKSFISPARLDRFLPNFAGRQVKAIVFFMRVECCDQMHFRDRCDQMHFRDRCEQMYFRIHLVTQSS